MANNNTYSWTFPAIDVYPTQSSYSDVVYNVHWRLRGTDQSTSHSLEVYGTQGVPAYNPDSGSFTPYEELTKELVTEWILTAMGDRYNQLTASLDTGIENIINPPTLQLTPPWMVPTPSPSPEPEPTPTTPEPTPTVP